MNSVESTKRLKGTQFKYPFLVIPNQAFFKICWDILITIIVTLTSIYVPLQLAFDDFMQVFDPEYIVLCFFWVDIILTFRTTYWNEDTEEIISPVLIAKKYIKSWSFFIDVGSALPISEIITRTGAGKNIKWVVLTKSLRLLRINRLFKYLSDNSLKILYKILRYFFAFLIIVGAPKIFLLLINSYYVDPLDHMHVVCLGLLNIPRRTSERLFSVDSLQH